MATFPGLFPRSSRVVIRDRPSPLLDFSGVSHTLPAYFPPAFLHVPIPVPVQRWTVVDLFSGAGGMSWGFKALQDHFRIVGAVDAEKGKPGRGRSEGSSPMCNQTYARNIGVKPLAHDLGLIQPRRLAADLGIPTEALDVLIACAPCTGFSQKQAVNHVEDDERNILVRRVAAFVEVLRPRVLVLENVKELLRGRHRHHFAYLRSALHKVGYEVWAGIHDLSHFGLPQRRQRALVIASNLGSVPPLVVEAPAAPTTVREAIGHLPPVEQGVPHPGDPMHVCPRHTPAVDARIRAMPPDGGSWGDIAQSNPDLLIRSMIGKRPGSFPDVYGRLWWDQPARTITRECAHPGNGRFLHPEQHRMLTVREMSILQGFPPDYEFIGPLTARYNQIGDAVPPLVARRIAGYVATILAQANAVNRESVEDCVAG
jgi:DNA (cytosine-5)-methyltransferase 1